MECKKMHGMNIKKVLKSYDFVGTINNHDGN